MTTTVTLHQPYFLPWLGYFAKAAASDYLLLLDKARFRRNHLARVQVLSSSGAPLWLTCPTGATQGAAIDEVPLPHPDSYVPRFRKTIAQAYGRCPYADETLPYLDDLLEAFRAAPDLATANIDSLRVALDFLGIGCTLIRESSLDLPDERSEKTVAACDHLDAGVLLVGDGGSVKVHDFGLTSGHALSVEQISFFADHPTYAQYQRARSGLDFVPGLSHVDALFNLGRDHVRVLLESVPRRPL